MSTGRRKTRASSGVIVLPPMPMNARSTLPRRDQLRDDLLHRVGRHREADADVAGRAVRRRDLRVDADHLRLVVEQRAARVAGVDGRVGLDDVVDREAVRRRDRALLHGTDDAGGGGPVEPERIPDRDDRIADPHVVGVTELQRRQAAGTRLDPEDGDVGGGICADDLRLQRVLIREADLDLVGALDHVVVRDDVAGLVDHEARAERLLWLTAASRSEGCSGCRRPRCSST